MERKAAVRVCGDPRRRPGVDRCIDCHVPPYERDFCIDLPRPDDPVTPP